MFLPLVINSFMCEKYVYCFIFIIPNVFSNYFNYFMF